MGTFKMFKKREQKNESRRLAIGITFAHRSMSVDETFISRLDTLDYHQCRSPKITCAMECSSYVICNQIIVDRS